MAVVVGTFDEYAQSQAAVRALIANGVSPEAVSVVSRREADASADLAPDSPPGPEDTSGTAIGIGTGAVLGGALAAMGLAIPGIGAVLVAGPLAAALAGASIGAAAGGIIGVLVDLGIPDEAARLHLDAVGAGATLVVATVDGAMAERAVAVMKSHQAVGVEEREESGGRVLL